MTQLELDKIIDKIQKLIALSASPVEAEAKLAMDKAGELMAKYEISIAEIREASGKSINSEIESITIDGIGETRRTWEDLLGLAISNAFDSQIIMTSRYEGYTKQWQICFIGHKNDVELCVYFHKFLRRHTWGMARTTFSKKKDQDSYCYGIVDTLKERLEEMYKKKQQMMDSTCTALVVTKKGAVDLKMNQMFPNLRLKNLNAHAKNWNAYQKGTKDGHDINISRPISNNNRQSAQLG